MALNVYKEARNQPIAGQYAVAQVTMNRAEGDPARVCAEVTKPHQFSWTTVLRKNQQGQWVAPAPKELRAWNVALTVARLTLWGYGIDRAQGAKFYHAHYVSPYWRHKLTLVTVIGDHHFYK